jgi:hypothetical protein
VTRLGVSVAWSELRSYAELTTAPTVHMAWTLELSLTSHMQPLSNCQPGEHSDFNAVVFAEATLKTSTISGERKRHAHWKRCLVLKRRTSAG